MFVANDKELGVRVTSLDPAWGSRFVDLRAWVTSGRLVCPGCEQTLRFRVGEQRRPHFAHRVLSECPLSKQSAEVLEAKALIYVWLAGKYPGKVELDVDLRIPGWDRIADLVVRPDDAKTFAYWVFDRSPRDRDGLLNRMPGGINRQVVFTESAYKTLGNSVLLTKAQRDFISVSKFDESKWRGHLHFLETKEQKMTLYRGLHCIHEPSSYCWNTAHKGVLDDFRICPVSGEIIAAEDLEHEDVLPTRLYGVLSVAGVADLANEQEEMQETRYGDAGQVVEVSDRDHYRFPPSLRKEFYCGSDSAPMNSALKCEFCGKDTTDCVPSALSKGTCVCRGCHAQYLSALWRAKNHE